MFTVEKTCSLVILWIGIIALLSLMPVSAFADEKSETFVQLGHQYTDIDTVAFSSDGKYLVTGCKDKTVKLWDVATGMEIRTFSGHAEEVTAVAISVDATQILSGDEKGFIKLWNTLSGKEIKSMAVPNQYKRIRKLRFSTEDGFFISQISPVPDVWDVKTGKIVKKFDRLLPALTKDAGDKYVVADSGSSDSFVILELSSGKEIKTIEHKGKGSLRGTSFSQNGKYALFMDEDYGQNKYTFSLLDIDTGIKLSSWQTDIRKNIYSLFLLPNGREAMTAGPEGITLWDALQGKVLKVLTTGFTYLIHPSPDGRFFLSTGQYVPTLWDTASGSIVRFFRGRPLVSVTSAATSFDGSLAIVNRHNAPSLMWDFKNGKPIEMFKGYSDAGPFIADGKYMYLDADDKTIEVWDVAARKPLKKLQGSRFSFSRDGRYVAEVIAAGQIKVWEFATGKEIMNYTEPSGNITGFMLSENNRYLFIVTGNSAKRIDIETKGEERFSWAEPYYKYATLSPNGRFIALLVTSHKFKSIMKLYDVEARREIHAYEGAVPAASFVFSRDGNQILFAQDHNNLVLCDLLTGNVVKTFTGHKDVIWGLDFSPNGEQIISVCSDGSIKLWNKSTGQEMMNFVGYHGPVRTAEILSNGKQVISVGDDNTTRLWDIASGKEQVKFLTFADGEWIIITPDGYFNASPNGAKYINVRIGNKVYNIDQFYAKFYRPELVQLAIAGKELQKGETLGDILAKNPAPTVQIISPISGSSVDKDNAIVSLRIINNGGGIGNVMLYLNGTQVANETRGVIIKGKTPTNEKTMSFTIPLMEGQNEIRVIAFNKENSMESNPALVSIISRTVMQKPSLYALIIGINEYKNKSISLKYAVSDAKIFAETLKKTAAPLFEKISILLFTTPGETTRENIIKAFEGLRLKMKPNDLFVFYNASHGIVDVVDDEEQYFLLTSNVLLLSSRHIGKDAMSQKELAKLIGNIPAQKKFVILDTCNAGKGGREIQVALLQQTRGLTDSTAVKLLQRAIGSAVFSASSDTQLALEGYNGHGLFTFVLIEGLKGKADIKKDGYITVLGLADYVEENVVKLSEEVFNRQQTPTIQTGANFPIGRVR